MYIGDDKHDGRAVDATVKALVVGLTRDTRLRLVLVCRNGFELTQLQAATASGSMDGADRIHAREIRLGGFLQHVFRDARVVVDRRRVRHARDGGEPAVVRKRFQGSPEGLARALRTFVVERGVSFCTYADEAMSAGYSKLVHGDTYTEGQIELLALLRSLSENMAFPRSTLLRALKILQKELRSSSPAWKMDKSRISDWAETLQRRIRNCCRQCKGS
jgi:hypothetical protein